MLFSISVRYIGYNSDSFYVERPQQQNSAAFDIMGFDQHFLRQQKLLKEKILQDRIQQDLERSNLRNNVQVQERKKPRDDILAVMLPNASASKKDDKVEIVQIIPEQLKQQPVVNVIQNQQDPQSISPQMQKQQTTDSNSKFPFLSKLERIVHIDLKGAPPKIDYFKSLIPMLKKFGATGILIEYEDTFPFEGILAEARYGYAYSKDDIKLIKQLAKDNNLKLIPLIQTYGHLEWLLKLKKFAHLREAKDYPQVITPCLEESYTVLYGIILFLCLFFCVIEFLHC